jgi:pilus assembly protein Flp/PilA
MSQGKQGPAIYMEGPQRRFKLWMISGMQSLIVREEGQDLVEYALVLALIALATVASMNTLAIAIETALVNVGLALTSAG